MFLKNCTYCTFARLVQLFTVVNNEQPLHSGWVIPKLKILEAGGKISNCMQLFENASSWVVAYTLDQTLDSVLCTF